MRVLKICSLLFSLGQFLLVLKLIELVRGNPTPPSNLQIQENIPQQNDATGRSFFLAPSKVKQKKYKLWGTTTTVETPTTDLVDRFGLENEEEYQFESVKNSSDLSPLRKNGTIVPTVEGRLCPVRFFFFTFCPLDIPFARLLFSKELMDDYYKSQN